MSCFLTGLMTKECAKGINQAKQAIRISMQIDGNQKMKKTHFGFFGYIVCCELSKVRGTEGTYIHKIIKIHNLMSSSTPLCLLLL